MRYRKLGRSELDVSVIGMGCWAMGGRGWGRVDDRDSRRAIEAGIEAGINFFDTADIYGFGHSEEVLGKALRHYPDVIVATKVGLERDDSGRVRHDLSRAHIKRACEASLRRLRRDRLDLYSIHWPDPDVPFAETLAALSGLAEAGKVRYFGASNLSLEDLETAGNLPNFVAYQHRLNLLQPAADPHIAPWCRGQNIGLIASEPLCKGMLSGKYANKPVFGNRDHRRSLDQFTRGFEETAAWIEHFRAAARRHNVSPAALAVALLLDDCAVVIPGAKTAAQATENAKAADVGPNVIAAARAELGLSAMLGDAGLRLNQNDSRLLREMMADLIRRDGWPALQETISPLIEEIAGDKKLNGPQKLVRIKSILSAARYPAYTRATTFFQSELKQLKLHPNIKVEREDNFETNALEIKFKYDGPGELREILKSLERLADRDPVNDALAAAENSD